MINKLYQYIDDIYSNGIGKDMWFMTKQTMSDFYMPFFIAEIIENYNSNKKVDETFGAFYSRCFRENSYTVAKFPKQCESENTYRNAIIAEFFGLFHRESSRYENSTVTPAYNVLKKYIKGPSDIKKYRFLVDRQIEKLCLNINSNTRIYDDVKGVNIFPVIYLYKVLLELHNKYGSSKLDYNEFLLFLVHSKKYSDWNLTMELIDIYRNETISNEYKVKMDNIVNDVVMKNIRYDVLFGTLDNIEYATMRLGNYYQIKQNEKSLKYIQTVIDLYEHSDYVDCTDKAQLLNFMQSDRYFIGNLDIFSVIHEEKEEEEMNDNIIDLIINTYNNHNFDINIENAKYDQFKQMYGKDAISSIEGKDLLYRLFAPKKLSSTGLTYIIEFSNVYRDFGGIGGGSAFKFPLFYSNQHNSWVTGKSNKTIKILSEDEAIELATSIRDELVALFELVENTTFNNVDDYKNFEVLTYSERLLPRLWVLKYLHLLYPEKFSCFYSSLWLDFMLNKLRITQMGNVVTKNGQISLLAQELDIPNVYLFKVLYELFPMSDDDEIEEVVLEQEKEIDESKRLPGGTNIILYGVPGAGKSWTIKNEYCKDPELMERLVFHPDYTYSDFVGQILPKVDSEGNVNYEFTPGPFTKLVKKAYHNPEKMFYLVIEEINRGNAPAIFGDVFQLLDRNKDGASEYEITNADIAKIVYSNENHKVSIPSNMCILCTMNTSDQNVFTLDTAFQRRWSMRLIKNKFDENIDSEKIFAKTSILDTTVSWSKFFTEINKIILDKNIKMTSSEDKRLGTHFVNVEDLEYNSEIDSNGNMTLKARMQNSRFPEKVLKYLWDDAFKFTKEDVFDTSKFKSLEDVIEHFVFNKGNDRFKVFKDNIYNALVSNNNN